MVRLLLSRFFLIVAFVISNSFASVVFEAKGSGADATSAQKDALATLSSLIEVKVDTSISSSTTTNSLNGKESVLSTSSDNINLQSNSFLVGIKYEELPSAPNGDKVYKAILTDKALAQSIKVLYDALDTDIAKLSPNEMEKLLKKSNYLLVLISYKPDVIKKSDVMQKRRYLYDSLHMSRIFIDVTPTNSSVFIDEKNVKTNTDIFVTPGQHTIEVKKDNYLTYQKKLYTQVAKRSRLHISLLPKSKLPSQLAIKGAGDFMDTIRRELLQYNIAVSSGAKEHIEFSIQEKYITTVSEIKIYKLTIVANLKRETDLIISKKATLKNVAQMQLESKKQKVIKALLKAIMKSYTKKG